MEFPITDEYSNKPNYLRWLPGESVPVRVSSSIQSFSIKEFEAAEDMREFHCQNFDLSKEEDIKKYSIVSQRILDGWYSILDQQKKWDADTGVMHVWMEWTQNYMELPHAK